MPNKPIRIGFKMWSCSCSCCGYLCTFQVYQGCQKDVVTGKKTPEKGLARRVVMDLVAPFAGLNHVIISILVVHSQMNWPKTKYSLLVLSRNAPEDFLII